MTGCCRIFLLIAFCVLLHSAKAQDSARISEDFTGLNFEQFVQRIEATTAYRFFYKSSEVDTLKTRIKADNLTVVQLLDKIFAETIFRFIINDDEKKIFITKRATLQSKLPDGFFARSQVQPSVEAQSAATEEPAITSISQNSIENRLFEVGSKDGRVRQGKIILSGFVRDAKNGEALPSATVYVDTPAVAVLTDQFGYYSLSLPAGRHTIRISSVGMKDTKRQIILNGEGRLNIDMQDFVASLKTVTVTAERKSNVRGLQMGVEKISIKAIKQMPVVFGEADVLRAVLTLPGVTSVGESSTGFNVRGGSADQNLVLLNDNTIYNPAHLFGFFSAFNPDIIKGVELYKSAIPEKYGGRLSSVLDVTTRNGNSKKLAGTGGIGPLTSKLTIEGPIKKDKTTFILGGRTTYSNWLFKALPKSEYSNSKASFFDINLHLNHIIDNKNSIFFSGYVSHDKFKLNSDTSYSYGNRNFNLKWKHSFNSRLYGVATIASDYYQYAINGNQSPQDAYKLKFDINQSSLRTDFNWSPNNNHQVSLGWNAVFYKLHPGTYTPAGNQSLVIEDKVPAEQALENALYVGDQITLTPDLSVNVGVRYSMFNYLGPQQTYSYIPGLPRDKSTIQDTINHGRGKNIQTWHGPEWRLSLRYSLSDNSSVKLSFNTLRQYIHMISNTTAISPTDIWKLSDANIKPQLGQQISLGFYNNFKANTIETSIEFYYKRLKNFLDYKSGAQLLLNHTIETDVFNSRGKAYGVELMVKKPAGKLNGWFSYTYSRTFLQQDDPVAGQTINNGDYYPANFDKPHNVNFVSNYRLSHRFSVSINALYSTGRPITLPIAIYNLAGSQRVYYSDRNQFRIPDYFRTDFSINIEGNHKIKKLTHNSWSLGVYNLTARENPYSIYFVQEGASIKGYQLSVFGTIIPFITYNFRF